MMRRVADRRGLIYPIVIVFLSMLIMGGVSFAMVRQQGQKFCNLMTLLDEGYNAPVQPGQPPLNERGQRIAAAIHDLRQSLSCD